ncbi:hypothetical protein SJS76_00565 [Aeromonas caviae]|uniref:hypothetical protein n=2 Tax=Aeromonas TaxID=642 RepID=UPI0029D60696|nr:hypothetical protein [Aeromonas caviae]MDX7838046.1 hypothetical protein [Aeromonas caviae]
MITAEGIVGKIVTLIVSKTVGKLIDLPFDKRKKACRSLTKLYYCVQVLDDVTEEFYGTLKDFENGGDAHAMVHALNNNGYKAEQASNMFIELGEELHAGLEIIDPTLASCCNSLYVSKFDFLSFMSNSIEWDRSNEVATIKVKTPSDEMLNVDLDNKYNETKLALAKGDTHYWPSSALDDFHEQVRTITISFDDMDSAQRLKLHIDKHRTLLRTAKNSLRELLKDNFSIEEVLFQNDSHPWR